MNELFFIDFSYDVVLPRSGREDLVRKYKELMDAKKEYIDVFDTQLALMTACAELASQAKDGCADFRKVSDEELEKWVKELDNKI